MSEDRLEKALEAIKIETGNPEELARAHDRVWETLNPPKESLCNAIVIIYICRGDNNRILLPGDRVSLPGSGQTGRMPGAKTSRHRDWYSLSVCRKRNRFFDSCGVLNVETEINRSLWRL